MRYGDGPTTTVEEYVAATPGQLWPLVTDINLPARFSTEFDGAEWAAGGPAGAGPKVGSSFVGRNHHPAAGAWQTTSVVVACKEARLFAWDVRSDGGVSASWRFELAPEGEGTRLRMWARMGPARSGLSSAIEARPDKEERIVAHRLDEWQRNMAATVQGIKALAESSH
jgi:Polyketide cyclase / dehydrase and lipid transport